MRVGWLWIAVACCSFSAATCWAQEAEGEQEPAETAAAQADNEEAASPADNQDAASPPAPAAGGASAEFQKLFAEWKQLLGRLRELQLQYKLAKPEDRGPLEEEYNKLLAEGHQQAPRLVEAAAAAYAADPQGDPGVTEFLISVAYNDLRNDKYEQAYRLSKLLADHDAPNPQAAQWAGIAAFAMHDFDTAETYLNRAKENKSIDNEGTGMLDEIPKYREKWAKESAVREKEAEADDLPRVLLKTNKGDIVIELFENEAPNTVANFISLVNKGFYNGLTFHRVLHGFMAQGGDPKGTGSGGPGYTIDCECFRDDARNHFRGTLSMAHAGRDTGGSQFFITFRPTPHLDGRHTAFGRVIEGFDVLGQMKQRNPDQPGADLIEPDKIIEATVLRKRDHEYQPETTAE